MSLFWQQQNGVRRLGLFGTELTIFEFSTNAKSVIIKQTYAAYIVWVNDIHTDGIIDFRQLVLSACARAVYAIW